MSLSTLFVAVCCAHILLVPACAGTPPPAPVLLFSRTMPPGTPRWHDRPCSSSPGCRTRPCANSSPSDRSVRNKDSFAVWLTCFNDTRISPYVGMRVVCAKRRNGVAAGKKAKALLLFAGRVHTVRRSFVKNDIVFEPFGSPAACPCSVAAPGGKEMNVSFHARPISPVMTKPCTTRNRAVPGGRRRGIQ